MAPSPVVLRMAGVTRQFGRRRILRGLDLEVPQGRRIALLGANGCGKTTLLRIIAGTLAPTAGHIERPRIAYAPQEAPCYPELTLAEHLGWWRRMHDVPADPAADMEALSACGLSWYVHRHAGVLSRGQRQRLVLSCAFAVAAPLTVLDEPFTALDAAGEAWLDGILADPPGAVIAALHDPDRAGRLFDETRRMEGGGWA